MTVGVGVSDPAGRFHGQIISLAQFDSIEIRPHLETKGELSSREFAITSSYLRTLAHARTLATFNNPAHFQTIAMIARAMFELAVDIRLLDAVQDGPERYAAFANLERLRVARRVIGFHAGRDAENAPNLDVQKKFVDERAGDVEDKGRQLWPNVADLGKLKHWSASDLRARCVKLGEPFHEIYDSEYAELSWYAHPGVGAISGMDTEAYSYACGKAFAIAGRCYVETLKFMITELKRDAADPLIVKKLDLARMAPFCDDANQAARLSDELLAERTRETVVTLIGG